MDCVDNTIDGLKEHEGRIDIWKVDMPSEEYEVKHCYEGQKACVNSCEEVWLLEDDR